MKVWRISNYADLQGLGGTKGSGRWHNKGAPIVYLAESPALAMLEVLVHFEITADEVPETYQLLEIEYLGPKGVKRLKTNSLHANWTQDQDTTRAIGDEWLVSSSSAILRVPSAIVPHSYNYLLNPKHELSRNTQIIHCTSHPYDTRLLNNSL